MLGVSPCACAKLLIIVIGCKWTLLIKTHQLYIKQITSTVSRGFQLFPPLNPKALFQAFHYFYWKVPLHGFYWEKVPLLLRVVPSVFWADTCLHYEAGPHPLSPFLLHRLSITQVDHCCGSDTAHQCSLPFTGNERKLLLRTLFQ